MTGEEIIIGLKKKDEKAFEQLVNDYQVMVYNTALNLVQSQEDADDVSQEVFISVYQNIGQYDSRATLKTWLYRITVNKSLDLLRSKQKRSFFGFAVGSYEPPSFDHPAVLLDNKENAQLLFKALNKLPEKQRAAFVLQKLEGNPVDEVAKILEVSAAAAESLLSRARRALRTELKKLL